MFGSVDKVRDMWKADAKQSAYQSRRQRQCGLMQEFTGVSELRNTHAHRAALGRLLFAAVCEGEKASLTHGAESGEADALVVRVSEGLVVVLAGLSLCVAALAWRGVRGGGVRLGAPACT